MNKRRVTLSFAGFAAVLTIVSALSLGALTAAEGDAVSRNQAAVFGAYSCCGIEDCSFVNRNDACPGGTGCPEGTECCELACNDPTVVELGFTQTGSR